MEEKQKQRNSVVDRTDKTVYGIIRNIPKCYHASDLRNFFSEAVETSEFDCFHFKHRPEDNQLKYRPTATPTATLTTTDTVTEPLTPARPTFSLTPFSTTRPTTAEVAPTTSALTELVNWQIPKKRKHPQHVVLCV